MVDPARLLACMTAAVVASSPPAAAGEKFVYVHDTNQITVSTFETLLHGFALADDGALTALAGSPFRAPADSTFSAFCIGPCGKLASGKRGSSRFLFSTSVGGVTVWAVGSDGIPVVVDGSPFDANLASQDWIGVTTIRRGSRLFVYAAANDLDLVAGFEVGADGALTSVAGSPFPVGGGPLAIDAAGTTLVVANLRPSTLSAFKIEKDGRLTAAPGSPFPVPVGPGRTMPRLDSKGRFLFAAHDDDSLVSSWSVDSKTKALTLAAGSPRDPGVHQAGIALILGKERVLTLGLAPVARGDADMALFARARDSSLELVGHQVTGLSAVSSADVDSRGELLVVAGIDGSFPNLASWQIDPKSGRMVLVDTKTVTFDLLNDLEILE